MRIFTTLSLFLITFPLLAQVKAATQQNKKTILTASSKPHPEDKKADGTPLYDTYEDFIEALIAWRVKQDLASNGHPPSVRLPVQSEPPSGELDELNKKLKLLESRVELDESFLANKQDLHPSVNLDPAKIGIYQRLDSDPLQFLVSLKGVAPYLNGYKATINLGNPYTASFKGVKVVCKWSKPYDWSKYSESSYKSWSSMVHKSETSIQTDISPGSWNPVEVILLPANQEELGYFVVSVETDTVSLSKN